MKSTNPRFSETDVTFAVKERLGWDDINVFPGSVYIEHDCDHEEPYVGDGHVFYDRKAVRYVPERTCRYVRDHMGVAGNWFKKCSECGAEFDERVVDSHFVYCPECGARLEGVGR